MAAWAGTAGASAPASGATALRGVNNSLGLTAAGVAAAVPDPPFSGNPPSARGRSTNLETEQQIRPNASRPITNYIYSGVVRMVILGTQKNVYICNTVQKLNLYTFIKTCKKKGAPNEFDIG